MRSRAKALRAAREEITALRAKLDGALLGLACAAREHTGLRAENARLKAEIERVKGGAA